jgi:hypothetical protein
MKFFLLQGKRYKAYMENSAEFSEKHLSSWRESSVGAKASKVANFPLMTKPGYRDR